MPDDDDNDDDPPPPTTRAAAEGDVEVAIGGHRLRLRNLAKVLYPHAAFTKADVVDYYRRIAPYLLPHLAGRPPTLVRAPDGVEGETFFEKRCPPHHPAWIDTARVGGPDGYEGCVIDSLAALVWLANLAALELHTHQARADSPARPTAVVLDLDPGPDRSVLDCAQVALETRDLLARLELVAVVKTSGSKGLHVSIPLNSGEVTDEDTKRFALALGQYLESRDADRVTTNMAKDQRHGRVFVDWSQNDAHKTTVAAYSLRIRARPTVSTPVGWHEVESALSSGDPGALEFDAAATVARAESRGDLYRDNLTLVQHLPALG